MTLRFTYSVQIHQAKVCMNLRFISVFSSNSKVCMTLKGDPQIYVFKFKGLEV